MFKTFKRLAALATLAASAIQPAFASDEVRIGFIAPMTGLYAQIGKDMVDGFRFYLEEKGGKLGGAPVKLIVEDDQGKPDAGVTKAKKLVLQDKVDMLVGGFLASSGYAIAPVSTAEKTLYIAFASADDLTQRDLAKYPFVVRTSFTSSQPHQPLGEWACQQGYKRVATIAADYAFGYEATGGFQKVFEDCGGKVVQKVWPPLGTKDFGPFLPALRGDVDAIFALMPGPMALQFPKQLRTAGIKKPLIGGGTNYDEFVLPFMGDEVIGDTSALHYSAALQTPKNEAFVKAYRAKYGKVPSYYSENHYTTAMWIDETLLQSQGRYPGAAQFIRTMQSIKLDAPRGPVQLDEMRNVVQNIYIKKVEKKRMFGYEKDELWNTVIKTYPGINQFWTYDRAKFLAQPAYSREFPPCAACN